MPGPERLRARPRRVELVELVVWSSRKRHRGSRGRRRGSSCGLASRAELLEAREGALDVADLEDLLARHALPLAQRQGEQEVLEGTPVTERAEAPNHRDEALAVPGEDAEGVQLHVGRELGFDAQRLDPLLAAQLAQAERAVVVVARAVTEAARTLPVAAREGAPERRDRGVASARRLAGREAGVGLRECLGAVVGIEADRGLNPTLRVHLGEAQVLQLH